MANTNLTPSVGQLSLTTLSASMTPITAALALAGSLVAISGLTPIITPAAANELTLAGERPVLRTTNILTPNTGAVVITGYAPGDRLTPTTGSIALSGNTPSAPVGTILTPSQGALRLTIRTDQVQPSTGALALSGAQPTVN